MKAQSRIASDSILPDGLEVGSCSSPMNTELLANGGLRDVDSIASRPCSYSSHLLANPAKIRPCYEL